MKYLKNKNLILKSNEGSVTNSIEKLNNENISNDKDNSSLDELKLVNKFTKREFSSDEIYIFKMILCDNEIDRACDRFTDKSLEKLTELFLGKTGIMDHNLKSQNQIARIFYTELETDINRKNILGMPYKRLIAKAYLPKSEKNKEIILALDSGIKKEISIHCSIKDHLCSICKKEIKNCNHLKSKFYNNLMCYGILDNPIDAYEWSFVVVPAQREAGILKFFDKSCEENKKNIYKTKSTCFNYFEKEKLSETEIDKYKDEIKNEINSLLCLTGTLSINNFLKNNFIKNLSFEKLIEYKNILNSEFSNLNQYPVQLMKINKNYKYKNFNKEFKI